MEAQWNVGCLLTTVILQKGCGDMPPKWGFDSLGQRGWQKNLPFMATVCVCRFSQIIWQKCSKTNHSGRWVTLVLQLMSTVSLFSLEEVGNKPHRRQHCVTHGKECQEKTNYSKQHISRWRECANCMRIRSLAMHIAHTYMKLAIKHADTDSNVLHQSNSCML